MSVYTVLYLSNTIYEDSFDKFQPRKVAKNEEKTKLSHNLSPLCSVLQFSGNGSRKKIFKLEHLEFINFHILNDTVDSCIVFYSFSEIFHF